MQVKKDTPKAEMKANYYKLSRLVHPDKCKHPQAVDAAAVINQVGSVCARMFTFIRLPLLTNNRPQHVYE